MGFTEKADSLGGRGLERLKRGGVGQIADLRGGRGPRKKNGCFLPPFARQGACHDITNSAESQTNTFFPDNDCITEEFNKTVYQTNNFKRRTLGNKKVFEKTQIGWRQMLVDSHPSRNKFLVIVVEFT